MKPIIRAAVDSGRPPLELILDQPNRPRGKWDGKLIKALYLNEAFEVEGYPIWVEESPDIQFQAKAKTIRSLAVVEAAQETHGKKKHPEKGRRFYAKAVLKPGKKWPTRADWLNRGQSQEEAVQDEKAAIMADRAREAEARAAAKVAQNPEIQRIVEDVQAKLKQRADRLDE